MLSVLLLLVALVASGCTSASEPSTTDADPAPTLGAAELAPALESALAEAGTARVTARSQTSGVPGGSTVTTEGDLVVRPDGSSDLAVRSSSDDAFELVVVDGVAHLRSTSLGDKDGRWQVVDSDDEAAAVLVRQVVSLAHPVQLLADLGPPDELEVLGTHDIGGVTTRHYRVGHSADRHAAATGLGAAGAAYLPDVVVTDLWIDDEQRLRRWSREIPRELPQGGAVVTTVEGTYADFGAPLSVEAPR